jgi:competence protein ComEC
LNSKQEMQGYVVEDPDIRIGKQLITFQPKDFHQRLLITAPLSQSYFYGDEMLIYGKLTEAKTSPDFDYQTYLKRFNVFGLMSYPKTLIIRTNQQNKIYYQLYRIKHLCTGRLAVLFAEPQNSLLLGILIGAKKTLPPEVMNDFSYTGTSHIIAISGYNITIMIAGLAFLAHVLGRKKAFWAILAVIVSFVIMTGASSSVVRAGVMGSLFLTGQTIGRQYHINASLFFAALVMLIINPLILTVDVGFQLSFAATAGIVYFMPLLEKLTVNWGSWFGIKTIFLVTMSAVVSTLPFLVYSFGILSLVAPLANILVLPLVPLTMLMGFLSVLPWVGPGFAYVCNFLLLYILKAIHFFGNLPYAHLPMQVPPWFFATMIVSIFLLYYIVRHYAQSLPVDES